MVHLRMRKGLQKEMSNGKFEVCCSHMLSICIPVDLFMYKKDKEALPPIEQFLIRYDIVA